MPALIMHHENGETTTITTNKDGTTTTSGWYGGDGNHSKHSEGTMAKEVEHSATQHGNPVVRHERNPDM